MRRALRYLIVAGLVCSLAAPATAGAGAAARAGWSISDSLALLVQRLWEVVEKVGQSMDPDGEPKRSAGSLQAGGKVGQSMDPDG